MSSQRRLIWIGLAYAAQGLGYATLVTALPMFKSRQDIGDGFVSVILLLICVAAAGGSALADLAAARWGSRYALAGGLLTVAAGLGLSAFPTPIVLFTAGLVAYGLGLGAVDASLSMQGVLVQARLGRSVMSRLFAAYTAAAIAAALLMSGFVASGAGAAVVVGVASLFALLTALAGWSSYEPARTVLPGHEGRRAGSRHVVMVCGALIFTAFLADSAVSTWSSVYLHDTLDATDAAAPLGYVAYQVAVLTSRMAGDHLVPRLGRVRAGAACLVVCVLGCGLVAAVPTVGVAVTGFALTGLGVGILVPLAFSAAGEATQGYSDEVIARVNLFNYGGALLGAVVLGALSGPVGLRAAFVVPVVALVLTLPVVRALGRLRSGDVGGAGSDVTPVLPR
ncbi:MFS transporter [Kineosporia sp. J2-2]|uniref:MFS transporter n=1 Tax=Kineosporia corallincola TaxID=2835133 RepID=A0ABS5TMC2_9ACTN|nr:MFS transporter [Kineosporia corallincola]MBT0771524.1 MFS transporter [Kineosporia corallincola]